MCDVAADVSRCVALEVGSNTVTPTIMGYSVIGAYLWFCEYYLPQKYSGKELIIPESSSILIKSQLGPRYYALESFYYDLAPQFRDHVANSIYYGNQ